MDPIQSLWQNPLGRTVSSRLGVAPPASLRRYEPGQPLLTGPALVGAAPGGRVSKSVRAALESAGAQIVEGAPTGDARWGALVFDATGITEADDLVALWEFFSGPVRRLERNARAIVLGTPPEHAGGVHAATAQRALEGFTRSLGKELKGGATANLVLVEPGAEERTASTVLFLASSRSAFVDGQVVRVSAAVSLPEGAGDVSPSLAGRVVAVSGASRGIGEAMVRTFAREGATVLGLDVAPLADDLIKVTSSVGGAHLVADVTAPDTAARIAALVKETFGGTLDGFVHNAGITRDRRLVNLKRENWQQVMSVNLVAPQRITEELVADGVLGAGARVVGIASIAGIAGNNGQTNYGASKAGVIGLVQSLAPVVADRGITVNALAPGFIETQMTQKVPFVIREGGRRLSSLMQGGLPVDVAEAAAWLLSPASAGVTGNVIRVCGQALLGA